MTFLQKFAQFINLPRLDERLDTVCFNNYANNIKIESESSLNVILNGFED